MVCYVRHDRPEQVATLLARLAPGWIGLYQFDVRLPDEFWDGYDYIYVGCGRPADLPTGPRASGMLPISPGPAIE
jgi:hypothetical protein